MGRLTLVTGGARAGKTAYALALARALAEPVAYVATAEARDDEMALRIARHQRERPAHWRTVEAPIDPAGALTAVGWRGPVVLDCMTLWTSNLIFASLPGESWSTADGEAAEAAVLKAVDGLIGWVEAATGDAIVVTNEVGLGIVPADPLTRLYRDALGRGNQRLAARAERVFLVVAGLALELRGAGALPAIEP